MPQKRPDPFVNAATTLDATVNPYVGMLREATASGALPLAVGPTLAGMKGQWRQHIAAYHGLQTPAKRLIVEIGCYKGQTLLDLTKAFPDTAFIGIDITFKRVVTTAQRLTAHGVKNGFCAMANAIAIDQLFAPGELDGCLIFFPDPWIRKAKQAKHRLVGPQFCERLYSRLAASGFCWLKTDHLPYFERANEALAQASFSRVPASAPELLGSDFSSVFEQRFHAQQLPTYGSKWLKSEIN
jgi:tRNA (guanine-N7-)-methyltransferase